MAGSKIPKTKKKNQHQLLKKEHYHQTSNHSSKSPDCENSDVLNDNDVDYYIECFAKIIAEIALNKLSTYEWPT
jgi:hypothetical protein